MIRLGVAVRLLGQGAPGRPVQQIDLSIGLVWLRDVLGYLARRAIGCYRIPDELAERLDDERSAARAIGASRAVLAELRDTAAGHGIRLTMHLAPELGLGVDDAALTERCIAALLARVRLLTELCDDGVLVAHIGGAQGDLAALERCADRIERLPGWARARIVIEPDERCADLSAALRVHTWCGAPVVLDLLHHQIHNRERIPIGQALRLALATWPAGLRPKIHLSTQRTEAHLLPGDRGQPMRIIPPRDGQHADFLNPYEIADLLSCTSELPGFDAMIEAKAGDLALLKLREDLRRCAPELAARIC